MELTLTEKIQNEQDNLMEIHDRLCIEIDAIKQRIISKMKSTQIFPNEFPVTIPANATIHLTIMSNLVVELEDETWFEIGIESYHYADLEVVVEGKENFRDFTNYFFLTCLSPYLKFQDEIVAKQKELQEIDCSLYKLESWQKSLVCTEKLRTKYGAD